MENILWVWQRAIVDCKIEYVIYFFFLFIYLFSIPEIHQSGYRTCHYIAVGRVQNETRQ